jgi:hypothetical protein
VGLAFVGAAPHFRGYERAIHYAGAGVSALFGAIWCVLTGFWPLMVLLVGLAVLVSNLRVPAWKWDGREHTLFCYEMAMFVSVLVGLLAV